MILLTLAGGCAARAQDAPPVPPPSPPPGKVVFSRDQDSAPAAATFPREDTLVTVSDAERDALTITAYDLDIHLVPANSSIAARAGLTVRNDGPTPVGRVVLQLTSTLHWESFSQRSDTAGSKPLAFFIRRIDTDADHTGFAEEAVVTLLQPLPPGVSVTLATLYSGTIVQSAQRLERIDAPATDAALADWDAIAPQLTALRGFGNVLWYPVAAAPAYLGEGAKLFHAIGEARLREQDASVRLRLAVEYAGDPPDAAWFCGRSEHLAAISDDPNLPVAEGTGVATALFAARPLGFRTLSLFVTDRPASHDGDSLLVSAITDHYSALPEYVAAADLVEPMLTEWLGPAPPKGLTILDHPGQPFEDGEMVVRPLRSGETKLLAPAMAHLLTHAWLEAARDTPLPAWMDEGLAQFMGLLWTERSQGRPAALAEMAEAANGLALAEPEAGAERPGESLLNASDAIFYRTKGAAVWWMLRGLAGDTALEKALQAYLGKPKAAHDPHAFEAMLVLQSHRDLRWFFDDWVYRDRGLPDLTLVNVAPRTLPAQGGRDAGWLVAVDIRNDGDAAAEVPVTVRGMDGVTETERLLIPGRKSASTRIVFPGTPLSVEVNDGSVPEVRTSTHTRELTPGK
jgi:hypothetical protein